MCIEVHRHPNAQYCEILGILYNIDLRMIASFLCIYKYLKYNPSLFKNCTCNEDPELKTLILNLTHYVRGIQVSSLGTIAPDHLK